MSIDYNDLKNSRFSIILWYINDKGEDEVIVYPAKAIYSQENSKIDIYYKDIETPIFVMEEERFDMIKAVDTDELKKILLGTDYAIRIDVHDLPEDMDRSNVKLIEGLQWRKD